MDCIQPVTPPIREAMIDLYFDERKNIQEKAKNDMKDQNCLLRTYLEKTKRQNKQENVTIRWKTSLCV